MEVTSSSIECQPTMWLFAFEVHKTHVSLIHCQPTKYPGSWTVIMCKSAVTRVAVKRTGSITESWSICSEGALYWTFWVLLSPITITYSHDHNRPIRTLSREHRDMCSRAQKKTFRCKLTTTHPATSFTSPLLPLQTQTLRRSPTSSGGRKIAFLGRRQFKKKKMIIIFAC